MSQLVILGAGGHGSVVADAAMLMRRWSEIIFLDDGLQPGSTVLGVAIRGAADGWQQFDRHGTDFFVAVGNNKARFDILAEINSAGGNLARVIHPAATVSRFAEVGKGVLACAGAVINPRSAIRCGTIVNTGSTVDHDCAVGQSAHLSPGVHLAGGVQVGDRSWIGIGSSVRGGVIIGDDAIVGAGASVVSNVPENTTVVGVPARPVEK